MFRCLGDIKHSWLIAWDSKKPCKTSLFPRKPPSRAEATFGMHPVDVDGVDTLHCHLWGSIRKDGKNLGQKVLHQVLEA